MGRAGRQNQSGTGLRERTPSLAVKMEEISGEEIDPVIADLIPSSNPQEALLWLQGDRSLIQEPEEVCPGMTQAAESLLSAVQSGQRVALFCDYDVDGVTGGEVLREAILRHGRDPLMGYASAGDGFGLTSEFVQKAFDEGCSVLVTIDCGSKSVEAINLANKLGMEVIVTDHHDTLEGNNAAHHINPQLHSPRPSMATGSQIAWHLGAAMLKSAEGEVPEQYYEGPLYLAGLGCVADWGPHSLPENRPFLKASAPPVGVRLLAETKGEDASNLNLIWKTSSTLNMAKRSEAVTGEDVAKIIRAQTEEEMKAAEKVVSDVQKAQWALKSTLEKEVSQVVPKNNVAVFITDQEGASGISGPLALKLARESSLPAFVFSPLKEEDGEKIYKFSGRVADVAPKRIIEMGEDPEIASLLLSQGGHDLVFSGECRKEDIPKIVEAMERWSGDAKVIEQKESSGKESPKNDSSKTKTPLVSGERLASIQKGTEQLAPFHKVDKHYEPKVLVKGEIFDKSGSVATLKTKDGSTYTVAVTNGVVEGEGEVLLKIRAGRQDMLVSSVN